MAREEKYLPVPWFEQETLDFCGPAVAQMFLKHHGVTASQPHLWTDIQANSSGTGAGPPNLPFPTQVCDDCGKDTRTGQTIWQCWNTTPEALEKTVEARAPAVALAVRYPDAFRNGTAMLVESLDRVPDVPPFATLYTINHWVVVNGYVRNDVTSTAFPPVTVGPYQLNGIYILDPQEDSATERVRLIAMTGSGPDTAEDWSDMFGLLTCGSNVDTYPVVVGEDAPPLLVPIKFPLVWILLLLLVLLALLAWWFGGV